MYFSPFNVKLDRIKKEVELLRRLLVHLLTNNIFYMIFKQLRQISDQIYLLT